ncbi:MAG: hypothetical protein HEQ26_15435 [Dolichospermum sp. DL01]|jgi:anthranilate phosphoribosyltransferase|nr:MAG: hypothetical protein HEQ26_15435 [Dolichospermum sp. DL01]
MYRFITSIKKCDFQLLYSSSPINQKHHILSQLGPLQQVFKKFIETEQNTIPLENAELIELFDSCMDITKDVEELTEILQKIAPGNKRVGFHQINLIVDNLRTRLRKYLQYKGYTLDLIPHDHAFGSGGDFIKTIHATTSASIVVAPLMTMCKTGTINVTSLHGSDQAMTEIGYNQISIKPYLLKDLLVKYNFAFVSLGDMGLPYSDVLKKARKKLWEKNLEEINSRYRPEDNNWQKVVRNLNIPQVIDIFKIVTPNAQILNPVHHSTGVCHLKMIPYIIGVYLHLNSSGIICHCYDGIDEVSNASVTLLGDNPNNLIVKIDSENITIAEFLPEDIGLERVSIEEIKEKKLVSEEINIFWQILAGEKEYFKSKRDFIVANAALVLVAGNKVSNLDQDIISQLREGVKIAENLIDSGKSYRNFSQLLLELQNQYA